MSEPSPSEISYRAELSSSSHAGPINDPVVRCQSQNWIRLEGRYNDRWETPMAGAKFNLYINGAKVLGPDAHLYTHEQLGIKPNKAPKTSTERGKYKDLGCYYYQNCDEGKARFEIVGDSAASSQADQLIEAIEAKLDGGYRNIEKHMEPYQNMWDQYGVLSIQIGQAQGFLEAGEEWVKSWDEVFTAKYWEETGSALYNGASAVVDYVADAGAKGYEMAKDAWDSRGSLLSGAWWQKQLEDAYNFTAETIEEVTEAALDAAETMGRTAQQIAIVIERRDAILALPEMVAQGDVDGLEAFIDNDLAAIDPDYAEELRYNKDWQGAIEILHEGNAVGIFMIYLQLFIVVVPPNFYAHLAGKAGFYIFIEVLLIIIGALLGGAGAVARIGALSARLARLGATGASIARKIDRAQDALAAFRRMLDAFESSLNNMMELRQKLLISRRRNVRRGTTKNTLEERRETEKRDKSCRICKKKDHNTPLDRRGECDYQ